MTLYLTIVCLLLSYMYKCSLVNLLMEEIKIKKAFFLSKEARYFYLEKAALILILYRLFILMLSRIIFTRFL